MKEFVKLSSKEKQKVYEELFKKNILLAIPQATPPKISSITSKLMQFKKDEDIIELL